MLHLPGLIIPGQLGPMRRTEGYRCRSSLYTLASSWAGMPSVMQTISSMPAAAASSTDPGATLAGTATKLALAPVASRASAAVANTGIPSTSWPPLAGLTPATTWVP